MGCSIPHNRTRMQSPHVEGLPSRWNHVRGSPPVPTCPAWKAPHTNARSASLRSATTTTTSSQRLYLDESDVEEPPKGGWPNITADTMHGLGKTDGVAPSCCATCRTYGVTSGRRAGPGLDSPTARTGHGGEHGIVE